MMTVIEAIKERHAVRVYQKKAIPADILQKLNDFIAECNAEGNLHFQLLEDAGKTYNTLMNKAMGLGSAPSVIACVGPDSELLDQKIGYYGEKIVIYAQQLGLNTCWTGTYSAKNVEAQLDDGERLVIVIAIGYGENQGKARKSKTVEQVIEGNVEDMPQWFIDGVEMALLAPTAINQQKFCFALRNGEEVVAVDKGGIMSQVDLGIVKYHFEVGAERAI